MPGALAARTPARCARHDDSARVLLRRRPLAKTGKARLRGQFQLRIVRDFDSDIAEREPRHSARDPANLLAVQEQFVSGLGGALDIQDS